MAIFYVNTRSKKKKQPKSKTLTEAQKKHIAFLRSVGYTGSNKRSCVAFQSLEVQNGKSVAPVSNAIPGNGFKRSIDDYKWKTGVVESAEVIAETERKKKKIAPICNKGSYQYITDGADISTLGKKV
jgi:hypothetical protein